MRWREFTALRKAYEAPIKRWAYEQATFHNAHFDTQGAPWQPEDFLGTGNRAQRLKQAERDKHETSMMNAKLAQIQQAKGKPPGRSIPFWAREDWDGTVPQESEHAS